ncbi:hypothetical protein ACN47E_005410 [Coniothyrium glycines]
MVLEGVGNNAPESFGDDNAYPSSNDPYAATSSTSGAARFDSSTLPRPLPIIGTFMGFSDGAVRFKTETTLKFAERKLGRGLDLEESQALAYHVYQLEQTKSYFAAAGAAAGIYRWYTTWDKVKYPFYQPKVEDINPNKFGPIKGPMAQFARHTWRFTLYTLVAGQMGNVIGQLLAQPIAAVNTSNDPKLERFGVELKAATRANDQKTAQTGRDIEARRREFQEQVRNRSGGGPSPQTSWGRPARDSEDSGDDMSPTAGNEDWASSASPGAQSWENFSNTTPEVQPQRQRDAPITQRSQARQPQSSSLPFDDDASPTGGLFQDEVNQSRTQSQSTSGQSSWDRLRRGATPVPVQRPSQDRLRDISRRSEPERSEQKDGSTLGDSYTFIEGDEERNKERARAQAEFDARVERERQGRDFSSEEGKKW